MRFSAAAASLFAVFSLLGPVLSHGQSSDNASHIESAQELIARLTPEQKQQYDIIFNDVDKEDYPRVLRLVSPRLRKGGLFITDNVLWSGHVAEKNPKSPQTKAILEFNRQLYSSPDFFTTILPIRDGLAVALKK